MNKILKKIGFWLLVIFVFCLGLYLSDPVFDLIFSQDRFGSIISRPCNYWNIDQKVFGKEFCYHPFCCESVMVYLFYLFLISPVSFFLFYKKQKLPAILFTAFGVGVILGTFVFFLIMP